MTSADEKKENIMSAVAQVEREENYSQKCSRTSDWNPFDGAISFIADHRGGSDANVNERRTRGGI